MTNILFIYLLKKKISFYIIICIQKQKQKKNDEQSLFVRAERFAFVNNNKNLNIEKKKTYFFLLLFDVKIISELLPLTSFICCMVVYKPKLKLKPK